MIAARSSAWGFLTHPSQVKEESSWWIISKVSMSITRVRDPIISCESFGSCLFEMKITFVFE